MESIWVWSGVRSPQWKNTGCFFLFQLDVYQEVTFCNPHVTYVTYCDVFIIDGHFVPILKNKIILQYIGLWLWCITPRSTIFQLYRDGQFVLVEETGVPGENNRPVASHLQTNYIMLYRVYLAMNKARTYNFSGDRHWLHR